MTQKESGFVAGTLVHTDKGLVPIEQIKVGDLVLSKAESGVGGVSYRPVIKTMNFGNKEIYEICYASTIIVDGKEQIVISHEFLTADYPIWIVDHGWIAARELKGGETALLAKGGSNVVYSMDNLYQTTVAGIAYGYGWSGGNTPEKFVDFKSGTSIISYSNTPVDCTDYAYVAINSGVTRSNGYTFVNRLGRGIGCGDEDRPDFRIFEVVPDVLMNINGTVETFKWSVFNIEIQENHTYLVGSSALWVHDVTTITS